MIIKNSKINIVPRQLIFVLFFFFCAFSASNTYGSASLFYKGGKWIKSLVNEAPQITNKAKKTFIDSKNQADREPILIVVNKIQKAKEIIRTSSIKDAGDGFSIISWSYINEDGNRTYKSEISDVRSILLFIGIGVPGVMVLALYGSSPKNSDSYLSIR